MRWIVPPDQRTSVGAHRTATARHPAVPHQKAFSCADTDTVRSCPIAARSSNPPGASHHLLY
jgi:hypothetical protein